MRATLAVSLALIAVLGAVSVGAAGSLAPADGAESATQSVDDGAPNETNGSNASMGAEVSAFMQASASDANASVDDGMFAAEWNQSNASKASLVNARTNALENRLEALQRQKERLLAKKDQLSDVAYTARMSALAARIDALQDAINSTSDKAQAAGVDSSRLETLRQNASELSGPEVAAVARNLSVGVGGPPAGTPGNGPANNSTPGGAPGANDGGANSTPGENPGNVSDPGNGNDGAGNGTGGGSGGSGGNGGNGGGPNDLIGDTTTTTTVVFDARSIVPT